MTRIKMTGLLWFDDNPGRDLAEKINQAAQRYEQKFGAYPNVCYVHPSTLGDGKLKAVGDVHVSSRRSVLLHHFFVGVEKKERVRQGRLL